MPFLNLVQPKQLMDDIWRASDPVVAGQPNLAWKQRTVSKLIHTWWGVFLGSGLAVAVTNSLFAEATTPEQLRDATEAFLVADLTVVPAAMLAYLLVTQVTRREEHAAAPSGAWPPCVRTDSRNLRVSDTSTPHPDRREMPVVRHKPGQAHGMQERADPRRCHRRCHRQSSRSCRPEPNRMRLEQARQGWKRTLRTAGGDS